VIGNNHLMVYRDAATELYDIDGNRMIGLNSMRSGCTTSFIPAGGVLAAPMLGHGCVCNYPMFASVALRHMPEIEGHRPASVVESWANQAELGLSGGEDADRGDEEGVSGGGAKVAEPFDVSPFRTRNATVEPAGGGILFRTTNDKAGYAVRQAVAPLGKASFEFTVRRAEGKSGEKRHGNAFFVFGPSDKAEEWIECQLYYGGRSSVVIGGRGVERVEEPMKYSRKGALTVTVTVDCRAGTVVVETGGGKAITARITGGMDAIRWYGYGGANSDNLFGEIRVR